MKKEEMLSRFMQQLRENKLVLTIPEMGIELTLDEQISKAADKTLLCEIVKLVDELYKHG